MAIQVSGTTVIDDSRNLVNVIGLKTINSTSILGSGDIVAGASTAFGAVGTYTWGRPENTNSYSMGSTASGIKAVKNADASSRAIAYYNVNTWTDSASQTSTSGTWRMMGGGGQWSTYWGFLGLWVRIS